MDVVRFEKPSARYSRHRTTARAQDVVGRRSGEGEAGVDKYRRQGMEYRFHEDAPPAPQLAASAGTRTDPATGHGDEPGAVMQAHADTHFDSRLETN